MSVFLIICFAFSACVTLGGARFDSEEGRATLDRINKTWHNARCRSRFPLEIKTGVDGKGWSEGPAMGKIGTQSSDQFYLRFRVSDRNALLPFMNGKNLRAGTPFIAEGWSFDNPSGMSGFSLHLRLADVPVKARFNFIERGHFTGIGSWETVRNIERYMRLETFEVQPAEERLDAVPITGEERPLETLRPAPAPAGRPELTVLSASVEPARAHPGEEIQLVATYSIEGLGRGRAVNVTERRVIQQDGRTLTSTDAEIPRENGVHQSGQTMRLPATLSPGIYELLVTIEVDGRGQKATGIFQVQARDP